LKHFKGFPLRSKAAWTSSRKRLGSNRVSIGGPRTSPFRVSGFGFRVPSFEFRVSDFGFHVSGFGFRVSDFSVRVSSFGSRIWGFGSRVSGFGFWVAGFELQVSGFGFRVSGFGFRVSGFRFRISHLSDVAGAGLLALPARKRKVRDHVLRPRHLLLCHLPCRIARPGPERRAPDRPLRCLLLLLRLGLDRAQGPVLFLSLFMTPKPGTEYKSL